MMDRNHHLPFKVGQLAESKSFLAGFRGAWFRCKINSIGSKRGQIAYALEFFDFPDEKIRSTKIYQILPGSKAKSQEKKKMQLMVRPQFPSFYHESQMPDLNTISEVVAIVDDPWKVGDLVDWWFDGCYWSGRVTHLLGNDKVQIKLPEPPLGEGRSYEAFCKDLRPSLDWSPEHGWTAPTSMESGTCRCCARLVQPLNQEKKDDYSVRESNTCGALGEFEDSSSSYRSASSLPPQVGSLHLQAMDVLTETSHCGIEETQNVRMRTKLDPDDRRTRKTNSTDCTSSLHDRLTDSSVMMTRTTSRNDRYNSSSSSKLRITEDEDLLSLMHSDAMEASVLGLEELAIKIKWLKGILKCTSHQSNAIKSSWTFLQNEELFTQQQLS